jgi:hypothetical protein
VGDYVTSPGGYCPDLVLRGMLCAALSLEVVGVAGHQKSGGWKSGWHCLPASLPLPGTSMESVGYHVRCDFTYTKIPSMFHAKV